MQTGALAVGDGVAALGTNAQSAADAYETVDRQAMPGGPVVEGAIDGVVRRWRLQAAWRLESGTHGGAMLQVLDTEGGVWLLEPAGDGPPLAWPVTPTFVWRPARPPRDAPRGRPSALSDGSRLAVLRGDRGRSSRFAVLRRARGGSSRFAALVYLREPSASTCTMRTRDEKEPSRPWASSSSRRAGRPRS